MSDPIPPLDVLHEAVRFLHALAAGDAAALNGFLGIQDTATSEEALGAIHAYADRLGDALATLRGPTAPEHVPESGELLAVGAYTTCDTISDARQLGERAIWGLRASVVDVFETTDGPQPVIAIQLRIRPADYAAVDGVFSADARVVTHFTERTRDRG